MSVLAALLHMLVWRQNEIFPAQPIYATINRGCQWRQRSTFATDSYEI
jgi:hypothetical protein